MTKGNSLLLTLGEWQNYKGLRKDLEPVIGWSGATLWNCRLIPNDIHALWREVEKQELKELWTKEYMVNSLTNWGFD